MNDQECEENRDVNALAIELINRAYPDLVIQCLTNDPAYYSQVSLDKEQLDKLINLFNQSPRLFNLLDADLQKQIETEIKGAPSSRYVRSWFLSGDPGDHLVSVKQYFRARPFNHLALQKFEELAEQVNKMDDYLDMVINYFSKSGSYQDAYSRFELVSRKLNHFNEGQLKTLLDVMNSNWKIYKAHGCSGMIDEIQEAAENKLGDKLDLAPYSNLS
ncbi:hypothetical protein [Paenibacillus sp. UNC451MF]|uniref:hypothetical protein n=1 Tax=Paenibacillus sp. UNC451MF TaxID=1449063 RepID=UPI00048CE6E1|nr:hypothetical protein [Paenibacillus sp. UNC451MF]